MTFNNAAWAIDGALIGSALARAQAYVATSGAQGIAQAGDLKVSALDTPGQGVKISAGSAIILNGYQTNPDQTYTVINPSTHTILPADMPASNPAPKSYIVAVVVGDPEFSQVGHPFGSEVNSIPPGSEATFQYVRPVLIQVPAGTETLDVSYPALPLARIDIPASTTTIINSYIHDIRQLARPRSWLAQSYNAAPSGENGLDTATENVWERFPDVAVLTVKIPEWAVRAKVMGFVEGLRIKKDGQAELQPYLGNVTSSTHLGGLTTIDEDVPKNVKDRRSYSVGGEIDVSDVAGTTQTFAVRGRALNSASKDFLITNDKTSVMLSVYFEEVPT